MLRRIGLLLGVVGFAALAHAEGCGGCAHEAAMDARARAAAQQRANAAAQAPPSVQMRPPGFDHEGRSVSGANRSPAMNPANVGIGPMVGSGMVEAIKNIENHNAAIDEAVDHINNGKGGGKNGGSQSNGGGSGNSGNNASGGGKTEGKSSGAGSAGRSSK